MMIRRHYSCTTNSYYFREFAYNGATNFVLKTSNLSTKLTSRAASIGFAPQDDKELKKLHQRLVNELWYKKTRLYHMHSATRKQLRRILRRQLNINIVHGRVSIMNTYDRIATYS